MAICGTVLAGLLGDLVEGVDDAVEVLVVDRRAVVGGLVQAAAGGQRLAAADLAGEAAPAERAPDERADALVEAERHQLPLVVAADERVVDLVRDVARAGRAARRPRATSSAASRRSWRRRRSGPCRRARGRRGWTAPPRPGCRRRRRAAGRGRCSRCRAGAARPRRRRIRREREEPASFGPVAHRQAGLGGDEHPVAPALDRCAEHLLRRAVGVDVGGVEHRDPGVEADVDEPARFLGVGVAPGAEQRSLAAERAGAEAQRRDLEARTRPAACTPWSTS